MLFSCLFKNFYFTCVSSAIIYIDLTCSVVRIFSYPLRSCNNTISIYRIRSEEIWKMIRCEEIRKKKVRNKTF